MSQSQKGGTNLTPTGLRAMLRNGETAAPAPSASSTPQPAPAAQPQQAPVPPAERVRAIRMESNDAYADQFMAHLLEFIENCPAGLDDAYALVDSITRGMDERMNYAMQAHLVMCLIRIKKGLPETLQRTLKEAGPHLATLTAEQQSDVMFSILNEVINKR